MEPTGAAPLRPTDLREIGPYRLLGRLGEGGMGTVFLARAPTGRFVALKVVKAEFANQEGFAARFHAEVDNARRVASFCTAQVLDNGNTGDGRPYMVTEYIAGTPLSDQITTYGALDPGPLHGVALGVAAALAAIHVAGLVHRDLKPANVILSLSGPRVIDFGIARALDRETGFTMSGELLGSPGWWAPEQVRGEVVNPAADIFAWGCLVAYAGNGRHPFGRGDPITLATRVLNTPPDLGALPAPLDELVRRATSMDVALRPTAQDLLIALVGGSAPAPVAAAADPPTLVATEMLSEWEPPQNVVDEPDITATFTTPPPSDATGRGPVPGTAPGQGDAAGRAGQSDAAGRVPSVPPSGERAASPMAGGPAAAESSVAAGTGAGGPGSADPATGPSSPSGVPGAPGSPGVSGSFPSAGGPSQGSSPGSSYGPAQGSSYGSSPSGLSAEELARREEDAAKEELARWKVPDQGPPERQGRLRALFGFGTSPRTDKTGTDESPTDGSQAGGSQAGGSQAGGSRTDSSSPVRQQPEQAAAQQAPTEQVRLQQPDQSTPGSQQNRLQQPGPQQGGPEQVRPQQDRPDQVRPLQPGPQQDRPGWPGAPSGPGWRPEQGVAVPQGAALGTETQPGVRTAVPGDDSDTIGGTRTPGTRWLIAAAAAVLAIVVTAGVLIVTSARNTAVTGTPGTPTQVVGSAKPNDVGRRFALGANFDDPVAIVSAAPECGLREYEGITATKGQLCVIRWTMLNPGGERRVLVQPVVTMVDDRGGEHDSIPVTLPPAILPGARVDSAFVFDLATYRKPVSMTANMLENGQQIEVAL
ncbi:protein kinase [Nonomuraea sp. NPDC048882]|uniref:serine/threonine-protein kinase n=1 Tax=Nonomuraea sp. NPDC048882 TaxID=3154347 RepID=UPI0033C1AEDB